MRPFLTAAVGLAGVFLVAELGLRLIAPVLPPPVEWYSRFAQEKVTLAADLDEADVVVVGDSSTMTAISPDRIDLPCGGIVFNGAVPGSGTRIWTHWTNEVMLPVLEPKLVVVGVTPRMFDRNSDVDLSSWQSYVSSRAVRDDPTGVLYRQLAARSAVFAQSSTVRDPEQWRNAIASLGIADLRQPWLELDPLGYAPPSSEEYNSSATAEETDFALDREAVVRLTRFQDELDQAGAQLLILLLPVTDDWNARYREAPDLADAFRDFEVVDLRGYADREYFRDPNHANSLGAEVMSRALGIEGALCDRLEP